MSILTRFLAREWLRSFTAALVTLLLVSTLADTLNTFLRGRTLIEVIEAYLSLLPTLLSKILPVCSMLATLFSLQKLKQSNELISVLASGYRTHRILIVVLLCSAPVAITQIVNLGLLAPKFSPLTKRISRDREHVSAVLNGKLWYKGSDYFVSFQAQQLRTLITPTVLEYTSGHKVRRRIQAKRAVFNQNSQWVFYDVVETNNLDGAGFHQERKHKEFVYQLQETPQDLERIGANIFALPMMQLWSFIRRLEQTGMDVAGYKIFFYEKFGLSILCILFALVPLGGLRSPLRRNSSSGRAVLVTIVFSVFYWLVYTSIIALGRAGDLPPSVSVFLVPLLLLVYIATQLRRLGRI